MLHGRNEYVEFYYRQFRQHGSLQPALAFTDNLPAGVVVASTPNTSTTCTGGTLTAAAGGSTITYTGGTVSAGAGCTVSVDITSSTDGTYANTTGDSASSLGNSGTAGDSLRVNPQPPFSKSFLTNPSAIDGTSTLEFTIDNSGSTVVASSLAFTDNLPSSVVVASTPNASTTCTGAH